MIIGGLQKTTLIDFPGKIACTVFMIGCNFRCPFCHNKDLISRENFKVSRLSRIKEDVFFDFLEKRKRILDGVCITGGEPTIQKDLPKFCKKIKDLGLGVKLDTNGSNPLMLKKLLRNRVVDFVAIDYKTSFDDYEKVVRSKVLVGEVKNSFNLVLRSGLRYEFRTTVVPTIHNEMVMLTMAKELKEIAGDIVWIWQQFRPKSCLDPKFLKIKPFSNKDLKEMFEKAQKIMPKIVMRGGL